ncbi:2-keto-4-pentenoate hydratase [Ilyonectria destructans]|nr:2-keto-4-pentenoate hydratase [Ilyonectria destructans]
MSYELLSYKAAQGPRGAVHVNGRIYDLSDVTDNKYSTISSALESWDDIRPQLEQFAVDPDSAKTPSRSLTDVTLLAPNLRPGTIFCAGGAYNDHGSEMDRALNLKPQPTLKERGEKPFFFLKNTTGVCGPNSTTTFDPEVTMGDWEVELTVVIGRKARRVPMESALEYVAGYMVGNDLSLRENVCREGLNPGEPFYFDWFAQKCFDGSCITGPWIVPVKQVKNPQDLKMQLWVGDELMQNTSTSHMVYSVAEQVSALSFQLTLHPGDMIMTGTGGGVGLGRGRFLRRGETVKASIEGMGEFVHHIA